MPTRNGDEILLGHHVCDGQVVARFEAQVAIGENSHQLAVLGHGNAGDAIALHHFERVGDLLLRIDGHRVDDHAAFRALHAVDFLGLALDGHVAVDQMPMPPCCASAIARCDSVTVSMAELTTGIFRRDLAGEPGAGVGLGWDHVAARRQQQHVVECEPFRDRIMGSRFFIR